MNSTPPAAKQSDHPPSTGSAASSRLARATCALMQEAGFAAEIHGDDVSVPLFGKDRSVAVAALPADRLSPYAALAGRDALMVKAEGRPALVVLPLALAAEIAMAAERYRKLGAHDPWKGRRT